MEFVCLSGGVLHWPLPLHNNQCPWARMTWKSPLRSALHPACCRAGQVNGSLASSLPCDRPRLSSSLSTVPTSFPFPFRYRALIPASPLLVSLPVPPSSLGLQAAILVCEAGLQTWAVPGSPPRGLPRSSTLSRGTRGLWPSPSAASGGWMDCWELTCGGPRVGFCSKSSVSGDRTRPPGGGEHEATEGGRSAPGCGRPSGHQGQVGMTSCPASALLEKNSSRL